MVGFMIVLCIISLILGFIIGASRMFYILDRKKMDGFFIFKKDGSRTIDLNMDLEDVDDILKYKYIKLRIVKEENPPSEENMP